jgi:mRNA-degrading endonuclease RelE of RelBE toxin-antitoxin system
MSYKVTSIGVFEKQAKKLFKKYPSLKGELFELVQELKENPQQGKAIGKVVLKFELP